MNHLDPWCLSTWLHLRVFFTGVQGFEREILLWEISGRIFACIARHFQHTFRRLGFFLSNLRKMQFPQSKPKKLIRHFSPILDFFCSKSPLRKCVDHPKMKEFVLCFILLFWVHNFFVLDFGKTSGCWYGFWCIYLWFHKIFAKIFPALSNCFSRQNFSRWQLFPPSPVCGRGRYQVRMERHLG